ncbi:MAG: anaerobic ribonucleoside-triphosphate reductase activating protein [Desulfosalsimonadaceae bacterium]|nr:anaerobic ribonucleoside-triphosphate reductase activating protein [Desulfosalsimonadaceae bacterium]
MIIGGIQKNSFIDFPAKISCVLFTAGCNFDCPYCHNPDLVWRTSTSKMIDLKEIFDFLKKRKSLLDGVVITGGEPTLQPDLFDFCREIKELGYPIKIDTNGTRPKVLQNLLSNHFVDYIAMDVKTSFERYFPVISKNCNPVDLRESVLSILQSGVDHEFRTTCVKSIVDAADIEAISRLIGGANLYALQKVSLENNRVLHPEYFISRDWRFSTQELESFRAIASAFVKRVVIR